MQGKYGISINQTDHIMKILLNNIGEQKTKDEVKFHKSPFPVDISFENILFVDTPLIGEEL